MYIKLETLNYQPRTSVIRCSYQTACRDLFTVAHAYWRVYHRYPMAAVGGFDSEQSARMAPMHL